MAEHDNGSTRLLELTRGKPEFTKSFYHLEGDSLEGACCQGTACFVARHLNPDRWQEATARENRVYCLGKCYAAPAGMSDDSRPSMKSDFAVSIVLGRLLKGGARILERFEQFGGYAALRRALAMKPEDIVAEVEKSQLRGRGGAGFPAGRKWRAVMQAAGDRKHVIANGDEGDPGAYVDRFLMEDDPHTLIQAMVIAGYAVGANKGTIYLRQEYPDAKVVLTAALEEARSANLLGNDILNSGLSFDIDLFVGKGSYVCGEETALMNSIEGRRPEVRARPPYPTEAGLWGRPTLVNNIETLANIPWIIQHGGEAYAKLGFSTSRGTKVVTLNSLFKRPGLYEVEFGVPVRHIIEDLGGGLKSGELKGIIIGGPLAGIIPPALFDTPFGFDELRAIGAGVGHGGVVAFDEQTSIVELAHHIFEFGAYESCGKCTPCRLGSRRVADTLDEFIGNGRQMDEVSLSEFRQIIAALRSTSLCGHGIGLGEFADSALKHYASEFAGDAR